MSTPYLFTRFVWTPDEHWTGTLFESASPEVSARALTPVVAEAHERGGLPGFRLVMPADLAEGLQLLCGDGAPTADRLVLYPSLPPVAVAGSRTLSYGPPAVDAAKPDACLLSLADLVEQGTAILRAGTEVWVSDVHTWAAREKAKAGRAAQVIGAFISDATCITHPAVDPSRMKLLQILGLLAQDAEVEEIEAEFAQDPKLVFELLRLVNSAWVGSRVKITSISHAISVLGRRQLQRWVQLLLYAQRYTEEGKANLLMLLAGWRARMLEELVLNSGRGALADAAFMTGMFSLLECLLAKPITEILAQVSLADEVGAALVDGAGVLGELLKVVRLIERGALPEAASSLQAQSIGPTIALKAGLNAMQWVAQIRMD